jgi:hypothetical protein
MTHQLASKLELILDRQSTISHESFAKQLETRLGSEGKEPDMRVWSKNKHLANVSEDVISSSIAISDLASSQRLISHLRNLPISLSFNHEARDMIYASPPNPAPNLSLTRALYLELSAFATRVIQRM